MDRLIVWQSAIYVMEKIVQTIKKQDSRDNLLIFVKVIYITKIRIMFFYVNLLLLKFQGSILLLKLFLAEGMTVCQNLFKVRTKEVSKVLKNLQVITRYIQNICNYTKVRFYIKQNIVTPFVHITDTDFLIQPYFYFYVINFRWLKIMH